MKLVGYASRISAAPGDTVRFMVSCEHSSYDAELVRLIHGDENPVGPGYKEGAVESAINATYAGRPQKIFSGSYVRIPAAEHFAGLESFTITAKVLATTPTVRTQGLVTLWSAASQAGTGLFLEDSGQVALWIGDGDGYVAKVSSGVPIRAHEWFFVAASYDAATGVATLHQQPVLQWPVETAEAVASHTLDVRPNFLPETPLIMGAYYKGGAVHRHPVEGHFNGRIDGPRLYSRALSPGELAALRKVDGDTPTDALVAAWDFGRDISSAAVSDTSPNGLHGHTVNLPTRAVTGHNYTGHETDWRNAPDEYAAIHFHDDDLEDAGWETDFELTVPADLPSGIYAARLTANGDEEHLPFFVRPARGSATAPIAILASTVSHQCYANFRDIGGGHWDSRVLPNADPGLHAEQYQYIYDNGLPGLYDLHSDGSGTTHVSYLRPILNMRPKFRYRVWSAPSRFPADLYMVDWLEEKGFQADVITDHDLHADGAELLEPYRVVITGGHPEYWTEPMLDAAQTYLNQGGRLMYLGGNGLYGVTSIDPEHPHVIEVRRWGTSWPFELPPGERHHSTTGELGGTWRHRGRAPQSIVGLGCSSAGFDRGTHYVRQPDSFDPRAAFIFEGIGDDEKIGDIPSLVVVHGAAGYEIDRFDFGLGSPPHALLLASSVDHSEFYKAMIDEQLEYKQGIDGVMPLSPTEPGVIHPFVRCDITFFETPGGGGVFSTGSIVWRACISYNGYDNNVSRMTENVLRRFVSPEPFVAP